MAEVLNVEGAFEARSKESSKRCNEGSEKRQEEEMELVRSVRDRRHGSTKL